jgi:hypothetical protein
VAVVSGMVWGEACVDVYVACVVTVVKVVNGEEAGSERVRVGDVVMEDSEMTVVP